MRARCLRSFRKHSKFRSSHLLHRFCLFNCLTFAIAVIWLTFIFLVKQIFLGMIAQKYILRACLLYVYKQGKTASDSHQTLCEAFGEDILSESQCRRWFQRFRRGDESLEDEDLATLKKCENGLIHILLHNRPSFTNVVSILFAIVGEMLSIIMVNISLSKVVSC